jgi:nucleoside phosphorylase
MTRQPYSPTVEYKIPPTWHHIVCALPLEFDAASLVFDEFWDEGGDQYGRGKGDRNAYTTGRIGKHNVVLVLSPNMGKASAAGTAVNLRSNYTGLRLAILVGICGGVPSPRSDVELVLGDVVISKHIVQYDLKRQYPSKSVTRNTVDDTLERPSKDIRSLLATFETEHGLDRLQQLMTKVLGQLQQNAETKGRQIRYECHKPSEDKLFAQNYIHRHRGQLGCGCSKASACQAATAASCKELQCDIKYVVSRKQFQKHRHQKHQRHQQHQQQPITPRVLLGNVGSGDTVMKSGENRDRIASDHDLVAFEMEGAGLWDEIPCIVVKGVCDYADSHKNKVWQPFAAATAASTTKALLGLCIQTDQPGRKNEESHFMVPLGHNEDFIGREEILTQLLQKVPTSANKGDCQRVAIEGLGGIGKTQIALKVAYHLRNAFPACSTFWIPAVTLATFENAQRELGKRLGLPGIEDDTADYKALVKTALEKADGDWCLIIDNADDADLSFDRANGLHLGEWLPFNRTGSILLTTRDHKVSTRLDISPKKHRHDNRNEQIRSNRFVKNISKKKPSYAI